MVSFHGCIFSLEIIDTPLSKISAPPLCYLCKYLFRFFFAELWKINEFFGKKYQKGQINFSSNHDTQGGGNFEKYTPL